MDLSRMYRIVETGEVNDPTPVDNVLRMVEERNAQKQQQARPQNAWGKFKNFAGSNAGRTLLGGLGAGLGVALTGGDFKDALGYGVIGAGHTVDALNENRQYANRLALKQQERADALAKEQRDREFKAEMQAARLEAENIKAEQDFARTLQRLGVENDYATARDNRQRQWSLADRAEDMDFAREEWAETDRQNRLKRDFDADQTLQSRRWALADDARDYARKLSALADEREYNERMQAENRAYDEGLHDRRLADERAYAASQLDEQRAYEEREYNRRKEDERRYAANRLADERAYDAGLRAEDRTHQLEDEQRQLRNNLFLEREKQSLQNSGYRPGDVVNGYVMTGNKKYDDAYLGEMGKKTAQSQKMGEDYRAMMPTVVDALDRAWNAATNGTGTGPIGGRLAAMGLNPGRNAGANYADIQSANTQMNTILRKKLGATGLTGSELNSAIEAQAYRYQIDPTDNESIIKRKIQNFVRDHLGFDDYNGNGAAYMPTDDSVVDFSNYF